MGWVDKLRGNLVGLDTTPLIYFTEANPQYVHIVSPFFEAVKKGEFTVVTSMLTLLEVLVVPLRNNNAGIIQKYQEILFEMNGIKAVEITQRILERAARIRATHLGIRTPDAIQLATAIEAKAFFFFTNDAKLSSFPEIQVLVLNQLDSE